MNEGIQRRRELTMTIICKACTHQYGAWRPRCPACGAETPAPPKAFNAPKITKVLGEVTRQSKSACTFCHHRGAKDRCPHCNELIHKTCIALHAPDCQQFQLGRDAAIKALGGQHGDHQG